MPLLALSSEVGWNSCIRGPEVKRPRRARPRQGLAAPPPRGHFPFPREKGSEKGSYQSVAGVARKPDFLEMSGQKSGLSGRVLPPPLCLRALPHAALGRRRRRPQCVCEGRWCPQGYPRPGPAPKNRSEKSRPRNPWRRAYPKSMKTVVFGFAVGFKKFRRSRENGFCSRALGPPRLAAGAGDRNAETLMDFYVLGLREAISACFFFRTGPIASQAPQTNLKLHLG